LLQELLDADRSRTAIGPLPRVAEVMDLKEAKKFIQGKGCYVKMP
jgi:hypothetical protein